jgi:hypothetical protein
MKRKNQYRAVRWKRNILKLPEWVEVKLRENPSGDFVAGRVITVSAQDMGAGVFAHLGLGQLVGYPHRALPPIDMGRYSKKNQQGWTIIRRDLPKELYTLSFEAPNFGDWSNGSHTVNQTRERFRRDYIEAPGYEVVIECLSVTDNGDTMLKITLDAPPLYGSDAERRQQLLFNLNLLQENTGGCDIWDRDTSNAQLTATYQMAWEFFPPGERLDVIVRKLTTGMKNPSPETNQIIGERVAMFNKLGGELIMGNSGFSRYIGAKFADDLVVFENIRYGNALYVLYDDWQVVSSKSRVDLLRASNTYRFTRIVHNDGWQQRFEKYIQGELDKRKKPKAA